MRDYRLESIKREIEYENDRYQRAKHALYQQIDNLKQQHERNLKMLRRRKENLKK